MVSTFVGLDVPQPFGGGGDDPSVTFQDAWAAQFDLVGLVDRRAVAAAPALTAVAPVVAVARAVLDDMPVIGNEHHDPAGLRGGSLDRAQRPDAGQPLDQSQLATLGEMVVGPVDHDPDHPLVGIQQRLLHHGRDPALDVPEVRSVEQPRGVALRGGAQRRVGGEPVPLDGLLAFAQRPRQQARPRHPGDARRDRQDTRQPRLGGSGQLPAAPAEVAQQRLRGGVRQTVDHQHQHRRLGRDRCHDPVEHLLDR